jgi:phosphoribosylamine--glycine ligase
MKKRFLVVGHEARDHAIAWKLAQSSYVDIVYVSDGNRAMDFDAKLSTRYGLGHEDLADFAYAQEIYCTIVGNTPPMNSGIVDVFTKRGLAILGAHRSAAMLEGSKLFGKAFMSRHRIPTACHRVCNKPEEVQEFVRECSYPMVLKADVGVSSDKSAIIAHDAGQAVRACQDIFHAQATRLSNVGARVLFEEFITGREVSYIILMDGETWVPLVPVRDYKRLHDADGGPNTGGMGSYAPVPWLTWQMEDAIRTRIVEPTLQGMQAEGLQYRGFLYIGIMIDAEGNPWVLEYNVRLGDTEGETILMLMEEDFAELALRAATGTLGKTDIGWRKGWAMSVALAPNGYPAAPIDSAMSQPFPMADDVKCFGGMMKVTKDGLLSTANGRTACVTAYAPTAAECRQRVYDMVRRVDKDSLLHARSDIGLERMDDQSGP